MPKPYFAGLDSKVFPGGLEGAGLDPQGGGFLRFGAFAWDPSTETVLFTHTILGGTTLDPEELVATLHDVALIADEYDDKLMSKYGGQRMLDLLEEAALDRIVEKHPEKFDFDN